MVFDNPPSYDSATGSNAKAQPLLGSECDELVPLDKHDMNAPKPAPAPAPQLPASPPYHHRHPGATMHHYVHPFTGEHIATPLPPDHPEMICLQEGQHVRRTKFGLLGIMAAVFFFPLGVALCLLDRRVRCDRCGRVLEDGVTCG